MRSVCASAKVRMDFCDPDRELLEQDRGAPDTARVLRRSSRKGRQSGPCPGQIVLMVGAVFYLGLFAIGVITFRPLNRVRRDPCARSAQDRLRILAGPEQVLNGSHCSIVRPGSKRFKAQNLHAAKIRSRWRTCNSAFSHTPLAGETYGAALLPRVITASRSSVQPAGSRHRPQHIENKAEKRRGRDGDCSPPPAQIPASGTTAPGSCLGS